MKTIMRSLVLVLLAKPFLALAQDPQPSIKFDKTTHEFGTIEEKGGTKTCKFLFENVGTDTLRILSVRPSCGCTASDWTKEDVAPGANGFISATYNPAGRPGQFRKSITVQTNDPQHATMTLIIAGNVTQGQKSKADLYPTSAGNLRFISNHLAFMDINYEDVKTDTLKIYNDWDQPMKIEFTEVPAHLKVVAEPKVLDAAKEGIILVTYDSQVKNDWGLVFDRVTINTNDQVQPQKSFHVSARIIQDFSKLSPKQIAKAPVATFDSLKWDFGTQKAGNELKHNFVLTNTGKSDLKILKVTASCGCTAVEPETMVLKKKKSTVIKTTFNTTGRMGVQTKTITIITNDPKNPEITLGIQGTLEN